MKCSILLLFVALIALFLSAQARKLENDAETLGFTCTNSICRPTLSFDEDNAGLLGVTCTNGICRPVLSYNEAESLGVTCTNGICRKTLSYDGENENAENLYVTCTNGICRPINVLNHEESSEVLNLMKTKNVVCIDMNKLKKLIKKASKEM